MKKLYSLIIAYTIGTLLCFEPICALQSQPTHKIKIPLSAHYFMHALTPHKEKILKHIHKHFTPNSTKYIHSILHAEQLAHYMQWTESLEQNINTLISFVISKHENSLTQLFTSQNERYIFNIPFSFDDVIGTITKQNGDEIQTNSMVIVFTRSTSNPQKLKLKTIYPIEDPLLYSNAHKIPLKVKQHNNKELITYVQKYLNNPTSALNNNMTIMEEVVQIYQRDKNGLPKDDPLRAKIEESITHYHNLMSMIKQYQTEIIAIQKEIDHLISNSHYKKNMTTLMGITFNDKKIYKDRCKQLKKKLLKDQKSLNDFRGSSVKILKETIEQDQQDIESLTELYTTLLFKNQAKRAHKILLDINTEYLKLGEEVANINKFCDHEITHNDFIARHNLTHNAPLMTKLYAADQVKKINERTFLKESIISLESEIQADANPQAVAQIYEETITKINNLTQEPPLQTLITKEAITHASFIHDICMQHNVPLEKRPYLFRNALLHYLNYCQIGLTLLTSKKHITDFIKSIKSNKAFLDLSGIIFLFAINSNQPQNTNHPSDTMLLTPIFKESTKQIKDLNLPGNKITIIVLNLLFNIMTSSALTNDNPAILNIENIKKNSTILSLKIKRLCIVCNPIKSQYNNKVYKEALHKTIEAARGHKAFEKIHADEFEKIMDNITHMLQNPDDITHMYTFILDSIPQDQLHHYQSVKIDTATIQKAEENQRKLLNNIDPIITTLKNQPTKEASTLALCCRKIIELSSDQKIMSAGIAEIIQTYGYTANQANQHATNIISAINKNTAKKSLPLLTTLSQNQLETSIPESMRIINFIQKTICIIQSIKKETIANFVTKHTPELILDLFKTMIHDNKIHHEKDHFNFIIKNLSHGIQDKVIQKLIEHRP